MSPILNETIIVHLCDLGWVTKPKFQFLALKFKPANLCKPATFSFPQSGRFRRFYCIYSTNIDNFAYFRSFYAKIDVN